MSKSLNQFRQENLPELFPSNRVSQSMTESTPENVHSAQVTKGIDDEKANKEHHHDDRYASVTAHSDLSKKVNDLDKVTETTVIRNPNNNVELNRTTRLTIVSYSSGAQRTLTLGTGFTKGDMVHIYRDHENSEAFILNALRSIVVVLNGNTIKETSHLWEGKSMATLVFSDNEWLLSLS